MCSCVPSHGQRGDSQQIHFSTSISLLYQEPKTGLSTPDGVSQMVNRMEGSFLILDGYTHTNIAQEAAGLLCTHGILLTHVHFFVQQDPTSLYTNLLSSQSTLHLQYCMELFLLR